MTDPPAESRTVLLVALTAAALLTGLLTVPVPAADAVDYERSVRPILKEHCWSCHGPLEQRANLRLDTSRSVLKGGESGPAAVPGSPDTSPLILRVTSSDDDFRMPPPEDGTPLSGEQISVLRLWIEQGASGPVFEEAPDPRSHWAFVAPVKAVLPGDAADGRVINPIDAFLAAARSQRGMAPSPRASRETLLRRAHLDLTGLPPTREELHAFLADSAANAWQTLVDRLLASPHYGERWARHWMDIWRYTDWFGLAGEVRYSQKHIWHWRDWIVEAHQCDKGYDQMVLEMLAADELAPVDQNALRATGFLTRNWYLFNRNYWLDDVIGHSSRAILGLTMNCARCHAHKYDPISQEDYYRLRAFFEPHQVRLDPLPGMADVKDDGLSRVYDANAGTPTWLFIRGDEKQPDKDRPLAPGVPAVLPALELDLDSQRVELPLAAWYPGLTPESQARVLAAAEQKISDAARERDAAQSTLAAARQQSEAAQAAGLSGGVPGEAADSASIPPGSPPNPPATAFVADDFSVPRPDVWEQVSGNWEYTGHLVQRTVDSRQSQLLTREHHPRDFLARTRFRILDGQTRSVGMIFDVTNDCLSGIYLSPSGSKCQLYHIIRGQEVYSQKGHAGISVENNHEYELQVAVRGVLMNVWVDGTLLFVCETEQERRSGRTGLTTYEAAAEFLEVLITPLSPDFALARSLDSPAQPSTPESRAAAAQEAAAQAEWNLGLAERRLAAAEADQLSLRARLAAETCRYVAHGPDLETLSLAAARAERQAGFCRAEADELAARRDLADAERKKAATVPVSAEVESAVGAAQKTLEMVVQRVAATRQALDNPGSEYSSVGPVYPSFSTGRRLALARWMTRRDNPLTARVAVNHIWTRHFGEPLVASMFDFGLRTPRPLHHDLLDWLAVDFMESGWSMKHLHRLIMTSAAYQMRSATSLDDPNLKADPDNLYLWRMNPRRMEAEIIRDSLLFVSGQLDLSLGGPDLPVDSADATRRRSLYYRYARHDQLRFLTMFDAPSVEECYRRPSSVVPQQALAMLNSAHALHAARHLAGLIGQEVDSQDSDGASRSFLATAFERVLGRAPTAEELTVCLSHLAELTRIATTEGTEGSPVLRAREQLLHALLNHSEFVTLR